jgi:uncharacterized protein (TIGR03435 family)
MDYEADADAAGPFTELTDPTLYKAFEEQAGLKCEATKRAVQILDIDHADRTITN